MMIYPRQPITALSFVDIQLRNVSLVRYSWNLAMSITASVVIELFVVGIVNIDFIKIICI